MRIILAVVVACLVTLPACEQGVRQSGTTAAIQNPGAPSAVAAAGAERPWKASFNWTVTRLQWPEGQPPFSGMTSTFGGRCSAPSNYVVYATFEGEATHAGRLTGDGSHCSQLHLGPSGPSGITYSDGQGTLVTANGSTLVLRYGEGTSWADDSGVTWFEDTFTFAGGTGTFEGATGGGDEGGSFTDFTALLSGTPVAMWQKGTITYSPGIR